MHFLLCPSKRWSAVKGIPFHPPKNQTFFLNFGNDAQKMQMMEEAKNFSTFNNSSHFCRFPWKLWRTLVGARARDSLLRFLRWGMGALLLLRGSRSYLCAPSLSSCPTTAALRTHVPRFRRVLLRMTFVGTDVKRRKGSDNILYWGPVCLPVRWRCEGSWWRWWCPAWCGATRGGQRSPPARRSTLARRPCSPARWSTWGATAGMDATFPENMLLSICPTLIKFPLKRWERRTKAGEAGMPVGIYRWTLGMNIRQATLPHYQKSSLDLDFWYCICQLNQYIYEYWDGNCCLMNVCNESRCLFLSQKFLRNHSRHCTTFPFCQLLYATCKKLTLPNLLMTSQLLFELVPEENTNGLEDQESETAAWEFFRWQQFF